MCVFGIGLVSLSGTSPFNIGDALTLVCGIFYALQIILTERFIGDCDALSLTGVEFGTAAVICLAGALIFESAPVGLSLELWGSIADNGRDAHGAVLLPPDMGHALHPARRRRRL